MKIALDCKKLHLRFIFGTGFVLFVLRKAIKKYNKEAAGVKVDLQTDKKAFERL